MARDMKVRLRGVAARLLFDCCSIAVRLLLSEDVKAGSYTDVVEMCDFWLKNFGNQVAHFH